MLRKLLILVLAGLAIGFAATTATADWEPGDGFKMHFPQLPDVAGWDVNATEPMVLADDWACSRTGWVKDIHFWGSWMHGIEGQVIAFQMSIYSDIPANPPDEPYSKPGTLHWDRVITNYILAVPSDPPGPEGWYNPPAGEFFPDDHVEYWQYNVFLDSPDWFWQEEGTIYWLAISAIVADPGTTQWGWKSTTDHWSDDAVWAFLGEFFWIDLWEPPAFVQSLDLAFVITDGEVCEPTDDGLGCKTHTCPNPDDECMVVCTEYDPVSGESIVIECICQDSTDCHAVMPEGSLSSCVVPDNGSGTADLPPIGCQYQSPDDKWMITGGLPAGTTIEMDGIIMDFYNVVSGPGGSLGGEYEQFEATLDLTVTGTGSLAGFNRHLWVPLFCETHSGPRTPGSPVQLFSVDFDSLYGQLYGDPDFCTFKITGGTAYGMPSPGQTVLTELPSGSFDVESFFDIVYQIEFEGCAGSQLEDYSGTTTDTIRVRTGAWASCEGNCLPGEVCERVVTVNVDGTLEICCECMPEVCEPTPDSTACRTVGCPGGSDECEPKCLAVDLESGQIRVDSCECIVPTDCHAEPATGVWSSCVVPDNGSGTADLPPSGCQYQSPDEKWMITGGLPPGTTIEMDGILEDFYNVVTGSGGSLGGEYEQFEATLDLTVKGTGSLAGFNRHLAVPVFCETHSAPRTPGEPVQSFVVDFDSLDGELFGDPDFCTFRIKGGTSFGMPSPGETHLIELPSGDFAVESFFDVVYQIEFAGCPASQLDDYSGTTTDTIRIRTGALPPVCVGECPPGWACEEVETINTDGTVSVCCECVEGPCDAIIGDANGSGGDVPIDIDDAVYLIAYIFSSGSDPTPYAVASGDADCSCDVDIDDVVYLITYIFSSGPPPCTCEEWIGYCGPLH